MKINSHEMLLINKRGLKLNNEQPQPTTVTEPTSPVAPAKMGALEAQAQNNIAFQGTALAKSPVLKKAAYKAMVALALLAGAGSMQSCIDYEYTKIDIDFKEITSLYNELLQLQKDFIAAQNASIAEQQKQTAWLEKIYNESVAQGKTIDEFKSAVVAYMMQDEVTQDQMLEQLKKNGKTQEEALAVLNEIKDLYAQRKYTEAYAKIIEILTSIDNNVKDIKTAVLDISAKMDKHHAEYMEAQNKTAEILVNIYEQDKEHYSINSEKLDSLIAINARQEAHLVNLEGGVNEMLAIGQDSTRFNQLMTAIAESKTEIDYEKFEKIGKMIGFSIKDLAKTFKREEEKTRFAFVDAINSFKYTYLKTEKAQTAEMKKINDKLSILQKFPGMIEEAIKNGLDIDLSTLELAIKENTNAVKENSTVSKENSEMIAGKVDEVSKKLDIVIDKLNTLIKDFGKHAKDVNNYHQAYSQKLDAAHADFLIFADKLLQNTDELLQNGIDVIEEIKSLENSQNIANKYLKALIEKADVVINELDSISNIAGSGSAECNGMTIEEFSAYMDEALPSAAKTFIDFLVETGLSSLPADVTELKDAVNYLKDLYTDDIAGIAERLDTIIDLFNDLKNTDSSSPDYSAKLDELIKLVKEHKCYCGDSNEGILGDTLA